MVIAPVLFGAGESMSMTPVMDDMMNSCDHLTAPIYTSYSHLPFPAQMVIALVLFGAGESMSMTPVMDDMMNSCGELGDAAVNSLSSILAASFSLGQMVGPVLGTAMTSRFAFPWATTIMAFVLLLHTSAILLVERCSPPKSAREGAYQELSAINPPDVASADE